jgi:hypothetical protein
MKDRAIVQVARDLIASARSAGHTAQLMGSLGVLFACPRERRAFHALRAAPKDVDVVVRYDQTVPFAAFLEGEGWEPTNDDLALTEGRRFTMRDRNSGTLLDVFGSRLQLNQYLDVTDDLASGKDTLSVTSLILLKLQIDRKTGGDWFDLALLLAEHPIPQGRNRVVRSVDPYRMDRVLRSWRWVECTRKSIDGLNAELLQSLGLEKNLQRAAQQGLLNLGAMCHARAGFMTKTRISLARCGWLASVTSMPDSDVRAPEAALPIKSAGTRLNALDSYRDGLVVIKRHADHAIHHQKELFSDHPPFDDMPLSRLVWRRLRGSWIAQLPWIVIGIAGIASFFITSFRLPHDEVMLVFEVAGVLLLVVTTFHFSKEVSAHAREGNLRHARPGGESAETRTLRLAKYSNLTYWPVLAALVFISWHTVNIIRMHGTSTIDGLDVFGSRPSRIYLLYVLALFVSYALFCKVDWYVAKQSNHATKTRDYALLFWFVDLPSAFAFLCLLLIPIVYGLPLPVDGMPFVIRPTVVGGAATLQILMSCTAYSLVSVGIPQHAAVRWFATVNPPAAMTPSVSVSSGGNDPTETS